MTRPLIVVPATDALTVFERLRAALSGDGPAILPHQAAPEGIPAEVEKRVAVVVETSGSTGRPKRVALSADALLASAAASDAHLGGPGQWLLALPANYIAGVNVLVRSLAAGTQPLVLGGNHFEAESFVAASEGMDADRRFASLVPAQLARLVDAAERDATVLKLLRRFDRLLIGGQATEPALVVRAIELGLNLTRTYGSSETAGGCVYDGVQLGQVGVRISSGQIELGGPTLAEGYLGDPERTNAAFFDDEHGRWYRTGDTGALVDGVLQVTGRVDGVIISGGVKVSLTEVESLVRTVGGLADAVVVRARDERWGEVPVVVSTGSVELASLRATVTEQLGVAAAPARVITVPSIPLTATGKPDRVVIESLAAEPQ